MTRSQHSEFIIGWRSTDWFGVQMPLSIWRKVFAANARLLLPIRTGAGTAGVRSSTGNALHATGRSLALFPFGYQLIMPA
jgi:hypothetical protein